MCAKKWLENAGKIEQEIDTLKETIQGIEDRLYSVTGHMDGDVVQTGKSNRMEAYMCRYIQLKQMVERKLARQYSVQKHIMSCIECVNDPLYRSLLIQKYILGKTIPEIAESVCYTERWTAKLLSRAVEEMECVLARINDEKYSQNAS